MAEWTLRKRFDSSYGQVAYETLGDGPPLVMIHGTPFSSYVWRHFLVTLGKYYTVVIYDLLGYGQSEKQDGQDVSLGVQPRVLTELLAHLGFERPVVVGHDFGGATTLRAHLLESQDFERIILVDAVSVAPWGSSFVQHVLRYFDAFAGVPTYIHDGILNAYIQDAAFKTLSAEALAGYKAPWLSDKGKAAFYRQIAQMDQRYTDEVEPHYGEITRPVHIFWGEEDTWLPLARGQHLHTLIPHASFEVIPNAGHLVQEDQPNALLDGLRRVLSIG